MRPRSDVAHDVVLDGRYRLDEVLGQGGMATVYRSHDLVLVRDVAVKLFPPVAEHAEETERHRAEMLVLAQLSHPGLVTLHDAGIVEAGGPLRQTYLVMELVHGPTLADHLQSARLTVKDTARIGQQLAEALAVVHATDVVHRDIKPANILLLDRDLLDAEEDQEPLALTTGPLVKLADFGIARLSDGPRLTMTGTTLGTATYLSPEQAMGAAVGPATDIYALGLVLLECLTGAKAFTGTPVEVAAARLNVSPAIPDTVGEEWTELLRGMTARDPADRPSAAQVAARLHGLAGLGAISTGEVPTATPVPTPVGGAAHDAPRTVVEEGAAPALARPPAAIPPRVAPSPVRRRRDQDATSSEDPYGHTQRLPTHEVQAEAERSAEQPRVRPSLADTPSAAGPGLRRQRILLSASALVAVVLVAVASVFTWHTTGETEPVQSPTYPAVDGPLGDALDDLQRSVEP
ncbi:serine/threonine-protein kinase [Actinotalea sp. K2]|uniref:serine/threonine-protein kinase n=1 Tax=Actinotalea sp. K2 TaxID=2939438 RepID=UPI002017A979|nr:serine/threonine-protein kinase [Actinotalea sp. K2]MCL3862014.1 serine/threonine protein kinase [Actinotalea sp. K2]